MRIGRSRAALVVMIAVTAVVAGALWSGTRTRVAGGAGEDVRGTAARGALRLQAYADPDVDFSLAIPQGWRAVVMAGSGGGNGPGYAIGFESPPGPGDEVFSDYLMVEILAGENVALFETDGRARSPTRVGERSGWRDELALTMSVPLVPSSDPGDEGYAGSSPAKGGATVELLVRQAWFSGTGYTVGLYAIGLRSRRAFLDDAFEVMLRTFRLDTPPFDVV